MIFVPYIRDERARIGQGSSGEGTAEKAEDEDGGGVGTEGASDLEAGIDDECEDLKYELALGPCRGAETYKDRPSAGPLAQRTPQERAQAIARHE